MIIDLIKLKNKIEKHIKIEEDIVFSSDMLKESELIDLENAKVSGYITLDSQNEYLIDIIIKGTLVLPCSVTLKPVKIEFETNINDYLQVLVEEIDEFQKNIGNSIDIFPIIWENILMEIPIKVTSEETSDLKTQGDGWKLIYQTDTNKVSQFDKLDTLLKKEV
ncbi:MAG: DUF177 domain-containing protein [Mycoplasmatota bacterium]